MISNRRNLTFKRSATPEGDFASTKTSHRGRLKLARLGPKAATMRHFSSGRRKHARFIDEDGPLRLPIRCRARTPLRIPDSPTTPKRTLQPSTARDRRNSSAGDGDLPISEGERPIDDNGARIWKRAHASAEAAAPGDALDRRAGDHRVARREVEHAVDGRGVPGQTLAFHPPGAGT